MISEACAIREYADLVQTLAQRHQDLGLLLEGTVTFTDDKGGTQSFKPGDTFFVPMSTPNSWKSEGTLRKIYCSFQPCKAE